MGMTRTTTRGHEEQRLIDYPDAVETDLEALLRAERPRLVRLCAHFSGDAPAAEDLAQETLFEAWRSLEHLRDGEKRSQWLSGIARNVCRRWARHRARVARTESATIVAHASSLDEMVDPADDIDLERALEREELIELLDRALALLPAETRSLLIERYVEESPHAEIAARLGLREPAVAKRLERGRQALQRLLKTELRQESIDYGLIPTDANDGQETRIWCPICGQRRLVALRACSWLTFWCPHCFTCEPLGPGVGFTGDDPPDLRSFKAAFNRMASEGRDWYRLIQGKTTAACPSCGRELPVRSGLQDAPPPAFAGQTAVHIYCPSCDEAKSYLIAGLALALPEGKRFWREHPRIHLLPEQEIEVNAGPAIVTRFESVTSADRFDVVWSRDSIDPISIHGAPAI